MIWKKNSRRSGRKGLNPISAGESLELRSLLSAVQASVVGPDGFADHVPGEVLVQFKAQTAAAGLQRARAAVNGTLLETIQTNVMQRQGMGVLQRLQVGNGMPLKQAIDALQKNPLVAYAEPNYIYRPTVVSNDTNYTNGSLWGMYSSDSPAAIGPSGTTNQYGSAAEQAWDSNITGSKNVVVGIIDEGIQITHPDLNDNIWVNPFEVAGDGVDNDGNGFVDDVNGWDFVNNDNTVYDAGGDAHGTHVAGTIGGEGGNSSGVVGVNWSVTMISAKFLGTNGGTTANAVRAVDYLTDLKTRHGINIVASNNSWGGGGYSQSLHDAIIRGAKQDILFVAAAGNSTSNNDTTASYPSNYNTAVGTSTQTAAGYDAVIAVASITNTGAISSFSSYGATTVDIGAPGSSVVSSVPVDTYANYSGTSMATPHVTGAVALFASAQSGRVAASAIRSAILDSAVPTASLAGKTVTGGRLNIYEALRRSSFIDLEKTVYGPTQTANITMVNSASNVDPNVADTVTVTIRSTTESTPLNVTLTETGASTGQFRGSVQLAPGTATADNLLQVANGDVITASFAGLSLTDTATVDAVAPTLSGLSATPSGTAALISFTTNEPATSQIRYGTSPQSLTNVVSGTSLLTSHAVTLTGLVPGTVYYYQVTVLDAATNSLTSATQNFTTTAPAQILFVDDDLGATYDRFFTAALNANSLSFDTWNVSASGVSPTAANLSTYPIVIWNTGYDYSSTGAGLTTAEQTAISSYLNGGGRIFISGQDILYNGVSATFQQNYLKVASYTNDVSSVAHTETGVVGSTITADMNLSVAAPSDFPSLYVDAVAPVAGASGLLQHGVTTATAPFSGVSYRGNYAAGGFGVVFSTLPFESISSTAAAPNNQSEFLKRTIAFLSDLPANPGIVVSSPSSANTTEAGGQSSFTVVLQSQPSGDVTIPISSSDTTEGVVSTSALVFTPANWNVPQTVTVTGVNDAVGDGDITYAVVLGAATSSDSAYNGLNAADVQLSNIDDDTAGITVSAPTGTMTTEAGGAVSFTVVLQSQPSGDVTIPVSSSDTTEGVVSTGTLVFTSANWNVPQTVTTTGVNDAVDDGNITYTVVLGAATSSDSTYNGLNAADVELLNTDDDTAGITVSAPTGTVTTEAGGAVSFTVKLNSEPTADVTIAISSSDTTEGSVSVASLTFTAANWSILQTVTVTGVDDTLIDGNIAYTVVIAAATSTDTLYNGINPADIALNNNDNEVASTKFYAVDDAAPDRTFEYAEDGSLIEFYSISSSNSAPRGIATVTAGDQLWVVDAARRVFIYNNSGGLLGSWTAGTLAANAKVEGIATDGTHIWIVDARADRVYYYANAASRLTGTQNATTSFALANGNAGPKDIVFGSQSGVNYLWVVNDASNDRVFRYTLNASGVSTASTSWLINAANARPTGITLDPSNATMDIWISDNSTDRIYRYTNGRTATAPALASSFALAVASGNGNVQGIADPPPAAVESSLPGYRVETSESRSTPFSDTPNTRTATQKSSQSEQTVGSTSLVSSRSNSGVLRSSSTRRAASLATKPGRTSESSSGWPATALDTSDYAVPMEQLDSIFADLGETGDFWLK